MICIFSMRLIAGYDLLGSLRNISFSSSVNTLLEGVSVCSEEGIEEEEEMERSEVERGS